MVGDASEGREALGTAGLETSATNSRRLINFIGFISGIYRTGHRGGGEMVVRPAQYLLRFDDLCPTMARGRWEEFLPLMEEFGIHPILAVVPDNRDRELQVAAPDPQFWDEMRRMEARGASIALHGYRHFCASSGQGMLRLHERTEFAGVPEERQREWIHAGLAILRGQGLTPKLWVAPRHGFDAATLRVLRGEGIIVLSDGFARVPFVREGMTWIPQQLWAPVEKTKGLWTICLHANTVNGALVGELGQFLRQHAGQFTSVDRVLREFQPGRLGLAEKVYERLATWRKEASRRRNRTIGVRDTP
jgi:predicted deacetylase